MNERCACKRLDYSSQIGWEMSRWRPRPSFDAPPAFAGKVERLGKGLFPEGSGAGEVDLLAINLLAIPGDDLGEGHRESPC